jgi:hypothetical protein
MAFALIQIMTSDTTPSGVASGSSRYSEVEYWWAFNNAYKGWITSGAGTGWLQYQFPAVIIADSYSITPWSVDYFPSRSPKNWTLEGSNNGTDWDVLDTVNNYTSWTIDTPSYFAIDSPAACLYYRLVITADVGSVPYCGLRNLQLYNNDQLPVCYLHARRDRMNMKGVSTQNSLG